MINTSGNGDSGNDRTKENLELLEQIKFALKVSSFYMSLSSNPTWRALHRDITIQELDRIMRTWEKEKL